MSNRLNELTQAAKRRTYTLDRTSSSIHEFIVKGLEAKAWLSDVIGEEIKEDDLFGALQNGVVLCKVIRKIRADYAKKFNENISEGMRFKMIENIQIFLNACRVIGVKEVNLFNPIDLYENKNLQKVIICILALAEEVERRGLHKGIAGAKQWLANRERNSKKEDSDDEDEDTQMQYQNEDEDEIHSEKLPELPKEEPAEPPPTPSEPKHEEVQAPSIEHAEEKPILQVEDSKAEESVRDEYREEVDSASDEGEVVQDAAVDIRYEEAVLTFQEQEEQFSDNEESVRAEGGVTMKEDEDHKSSEEETKKETKTIEEPKQVQPTEPSGTPIIVEERKEKKKKKDKKDKQAKKEKKEKKRMEREAKKLQASGATQETNTTTGSEETPKKKEKKDKKDKKDKKEKKEKKERKKKKREEEAALVSQAESGKPAEDPQHAVEEPEPVVEEPPKHEEPTRVEPNQEHQTYESKPVEEPPKTEETTLVEEELQSPPPLPPEPTPSSATSWKVAVINAVVQDDGSSSDGKSERACLTGSDDEDRRPIQYLRTGSRGAANAIKPEKVEKGSDDEKAEVDISSSEEEEVPSSEEYSDEEDRKTRELKKLVAKLSKQLDHQKELRKGYMLTFNDMEEKLSVIKHEIVEYHDAAERGLLVGKSDREKEQETTNGEPVRVGFLEKKGALRRNWLKRHFVLARDHVLRYYGKVNDTTPKGEINLINATVFTNVVRDGETQDLFFIVRTPDRDFLLRSSSKREKDEWVNAIAKECLRRGVVPKRTGTNNFYGAPGNASGKKK